jgi:hypothetical protein
MNVVDNAGFNDQRVSVNRQLKAALNRFFTKHPSYAEGCVIRKDFDGAPYALVVESSMLYDALQGEYGWSIHTAFYNSFNDTGFHPEMMNACVVGFYKD